ncbi:MAG: CCA tRNA nucleotidyltransferase [Chloroflexi bacterium]|nr:CCA tRNA nucleotidyltransferase [Chloroflexota bacterium]
MNLAPQVERYLPHQVLELVGTISREADRLGQRAYLVGGVVRDLLLGHPNFDLDLVVEGDALELAERLAGTTQAKLATHPRFGTAKLSCGDFTLDLATARGETYARPGALPTVTPGTLSDDLLRRDFSINAMTISLAPDDYGELVDPYQGKVDLEHGLVRVLHSRSFCDDATRILRAVRYEQRLGFSLEPETARLLERDIPMLRTISADRTRHELELILREKHPEHAIRRLGELGVLPEIHPALKGNGWIAGSFDKARQLSRAGQLPSLYLCLLVYHLSEQQNERFIERLNLPNSLADVLRHTLRLKTGLPFLNRPSIRRSEIYRFLREFRPVAIQSNVIASEFRSASLKLELFLTTLRYVKTSVDGERLRELGFPAGPELGIALRRLQTARLDGEVKTRAEEEKLALSLNPQGD